MNTKYYPHFNKLSTVKNISNTSLHNNNQTDGGRRIVHTFFMFECYKEGVEKCKTAITHCLINVHILE